MAAPREPPSGSMLCNSVVFFLRCNAQTLDGILNCNIDDHAVIVYGNNNVKRSETQMQITRDKQIGTLVKRAVQKLALLLVGNGASYLAAPMRDRAYSDQVQSQLDKHNSSAIHVVRGPCLRSCVNYGLRRKVSKMLFIYTRFTYEHILSCAKTSRTSNFPTCRKRHRYMEEVR